MAAWASVLATTLLFIATIYEPRALMLAALPSAMMFLGFWKVGQLEGRIFLQVMSLLTAVLIIVGAVTFHNILALAAENYIFALYFFTAVYFSIGLMMLLFGSALIPVQVHYGGPAVLSGILGVITGIGYATIAFAPFATLFSIGFYASVVFFLFRAASMEANGVWKGHKRY
jgi:hypothetical protein